MSVTQFTTSGTYTVPAGCSWLRYRLQGAPGGGANGGDGAGQVGYLAVTPGETLNIDVFAKPSGATPASGSGAGAGGTGPAGNGFAGGGATRIRRGTTWVVMAAGGGGQGGTSTASGGDNVGSQDDGNSSTSSSTFGRPDTTTYGQNGGGVSPGGGASSFSGGSAGSGATAGSLQTGGAGASTTTAGHYGGGGGGSGRYGGGGGSAGATSGGGGAGADFVTNASTTVHVSSYGFGAANMAQAPTLVTTGGIAVLEPCFEAPEDLIFNHDNEGSPFPAGVAAMEPYDPADPQSTTQVEFSNLPARSRVLLRPGQLNQTTSSSASYQNAGWRLANFGLPYSATKSRVIPAHTIIPFKIVVTGVSGTGSLGSVVAALKARLYRVSSVSASSGTLLDTADVQFGNDGLPPGTGISEEVWLRFRSNSDITLEPGQALHVEIDMGFYQPNTFLGTEQAPGGTFRYSIATGADTTSNARGYYPPYSEIVPAITSLTATSTMTTSASVLRRAQATLSADSSLSADGTRAARGALVMQADASMAAAGATAPRQLGVAHLPAASAMNVDAIAFDPPPQAPTAPKYLRTTRTGANSSFGTIYDLRDEASVATDSNTVLEWTQSSGTASRKARPYETNSTSSAEFSDSLLSYAWAMPDTEHGSQYGGVKYLPGTYGFQFQLAKSEFLAQDQYVRFLWRWSKVSTVGGRTTLFSGTTNPVLINTANGAWSTYSMSQTLAVPIELAAGERLQLEFWLRTTTSGGTTAGPGRDITIAMRTNSSLASVTLPDNESYGNAPRVTGVADLTAAATLTASARATAVAAAPLEATSTLTATGVRKQLAAAALAGDATLTAAGAVGRRGAAALVAAGTLTAAGDARAPVLGASILAADSVLTANGNAFTPDPRPVAATPTLRLRSTRTSPNSGGIYDLLTTSGSFDTTTVARFTGIAGATRIRFQPYVQNSINVGIVANAPIDNGWADPDGQHPPQFGDTQYEAGTWSVTATITKQGEAIPTGHTVRLIARFVLLGPTGSVIKQFTATSNNVGFANTSTDTRSITASAVRFAEDVPAGGRIYVDLFLEYLTGAPTAQVDYVLRTNDSFSSSVSLPNHLSFGNAPRVNGDANLSAQATLTAAGRVDVKAAAALAGSSSLTTTAVLTTSAAAQLAATSTLFAQTKSDIEPVLLASYQPRYTRNSASSTTTGTNNTSRRDLRRAAGTSELSTTVAPFTGALGPDTIRFTPYTSSSSGQVSIPSAGDGGLLAGWRDPEPEIDHIPGKYGAEYTVQPGTWTVRGKLSKSGQTITSDVRCRWVAVLQKVGPGTADIPTVIGVVQGLPVVLSGTNVANTTTASVNLPEVFFAQGELLQVTYYVQTLNASNVPTPPGAGVNIALHTDGETSSAITAIPGVKSPADQRALGVAPLSATSTLTAAGNTIPQVTGAAALSAASTLSVDATVNTIQGAVAGAYGTSSMTVAAGPVTAVSAAALAADASVLIMANLGVFETAAIEGESFISVAGTRRVFEAAALSATSSLTAASFARRFAAAALSADSSLTVEAIRRQFGASALSAAATLAVAGTVTRLGVAALSAAATLTAAGVTRLDGAVDLSADSALTVAGTRVPVGAAALAADSTLTSAAIATRFGTAVLAGASSLTVAGLRTAVSSAALSASATLTAAGTAGRTVEALLAADSALTAGLEFVRRTYAFPQANGSAWSSAEWTTLSQSGVAQFTVQDGRGRITLPANVEVNTGVAIPRRQGFALQSGPRGLRWRIRVNRVTTGGSNNLRLGFAQEDDWTDTLGVARNGWFIDCDNASGLYRIRYAENGIAFNADNFTASWQFDGYFEIEYEPALRRVRVWHWSAANGPERPVSPNLTYTAPSSVSRRTEGLFSVGFTEGGGLQAHNVEVSELSISSLEGIWITARGACNLVGEATLAAPGFLRVPGAVDLAGESSLTAVSDALLVVAAAPMEAESFLAVDATRVQFAVGELMEATSTLSVAATPVVLAAAQLTGASALTAVATPRVLAAVAMSSTSSMAVPGYLQVQAAVALSSDASLAVAAVLTRRGAAALSSDSTLLAIALQQYLLEAALVATSTLSVAATRTQLASAALVADSTLVPDGRPGRLGVASLVADSDLTMAPSGTFLRVLAAAALIQDSELLAAGIRTRLGTAVLAGDGQLEIGSFAQTFAAAALAGDSTLTAGATPRVLAAALLQGDGVLTVPGYLVVRSGILPNLVSESFLTVAGNVLSSTGVLMNGQATLTAAGQAATFARLDIVALSDLTVGAYATALGVASLASTSTLTTEAVLRVLAAASLVATSDLTAASIRLQPGGALLNAQAVLTAGSLVTQRAAVALYNDATMFILGTVARAGIMPLVGEGVLAVAGQVTNVQAAALAGTSSLTAAAGAVLVYAVAPLQGVASLTAAAQVTVLASATLAATGQLTAGSRVDTTGAAALVGDGSVYVGDVVLTYAAAMLQAAGTLTVAETVLAVASAALVGSSALSAGDQVTAVAAAALVGAGALYAGPSVDVLAVAALVGAGVLGVDVAVTVYAEAHLEGAATLVVAGELTVPAAAALVGLAQLYVETRLDVPGAADLVGDSTLAVASYLLTTGAADLVADSDLVADTRLRQVADAQLAASSELAVAATPVVVSSVLLEGDASLVTTAQRLAVGLAALVADSALTSAPRVFQLAAIQLSADAVLTVLAEVVPRGPQEVVLTVRAEVAVLDVVVASYAIETEVAVPMVNVEASAVEQAATVAGEAF